MISIRLGRGLCAHAPAHCEKPKPSYRPDTNSYRGIAASASTIGPKSHQQDVALHLDLGRIRITAVADGVSNHPESHIAAQTAAFRVLSTLSSYELGRHPIGVSTITKVFAHLNRPLSEIHSRLSPSPAGGAASTLILAIDFPDRMVIGHVGDGAAIVTTGSLRRPRNVLIPQVDPVGGLTRYVGLDQEGPEPAIVELPKVWPDGGIVVIGSDGALPEGEAIKSSIDVLTSIRDLVAGATTAVIDPHAVLEDWIRGQATNDNRSMAVLISREAVAFWRGLNGGAETQP